MGGCAQTRGGVDEEGGARLGVVSMRRVGRC